MHLYIRSLSCLFLDLRLCSGHCYRKSLFLSGILKTMFLGIQVRSKDELKVLYINQISSRDLENKLAGCKKAGSARLTGRSLKDE